MLLSKQEMLEKSFKPTICCFFLFIPLVSGLYIIIKNTLTCLQECGKYMTTLKLNLILIMVKCEKKKKK